MATKKPAPEVIQETVEAPEVKVEKLPKNTRRISETMTITQN